MEQSDAAWVEPSEDFIKQCEVAGAVYNRYSGYFELNGLIDLTTRHMMAIIAVGHQSLQPFAYCGMGNVKIRTNLPPKTMDTVKGSFDYLCYGQNEMEVFVLHQGYLSPHNNQCARVLSAAQWFGGCLSLRKILGRIELWKEANQNLIWYSCRNIEDISLHLMYCGTDLSTLPHLSFYSISYMVNNAVTITPITITVHADVYAKLTDENNTEWHQVLLDAAEKQITFATPT